MGTAWHKSSAYPWETTRYVSGIEVVKVNITLRIYSAKWHVYAGLAILNPAAQAQIQQYARSASELFKLMVQNKGEELSERVWASREQVFGWQENQEGTMKDGRRGPILLSEDVLDQFSLGKGAMMEMEREKSSNSHLSLLAMVDCWAKLGIRPYEHLDVAGTPVFMLWIGTSTFSHQEDLLIVRRGGVPISFTDIIGFSYQGRLV
jgi:prephenate dehydrogenase (NADP+)